MSPHSDILSVFRNALNGGGLPPDLVLGAADEAARRLAVYQNNVAHSLIEALAARFPVIRRLVGSDFFAALARCYIEADGPRSPVLAEWGESFAEFLSTFPPLASYPYMADVARIEFARGRAFHAADALPIDPAWFSAQDPWSARLDLHPSVHVLRLEHPAVSIWERNQPGGEQVTLPAGGEIALILRDRSFDVPVRAISPGDAALIEALREGDSLGSAAGRARSAEPDHDPRDILIHLMRQGALITPEQT
ncbi:MAG: putative DNA-binding domain-containing protein [Aestuariivirga sp.]|nr:putative DNA-binding domain-containing protein [Aestuariivirga sp.]